MVRIKGLGRGLDALLGGDAPDRGESLEQIGVGLLQPGRYQPRSRMDAASIAELAESIRSQGVIQPILARPLPDGRYEIIAGERRWRAAQQAELQTVPVIVRQAPDDQVLALALIENIQREGLSPLEEAAGIQRLISEFGLTHEAAAHAVGRSRSAVTNLLRLLSLAAEVQELLLEGRIEMGHARALLSLKPAEQLNFAHRAAAESLSVREIEALVQTHSRKPAPTPRAKPNRDQDIAALEEELSAHLATAVTIAHRRGGAGRVSVDYSSLDQLDDLLARLRR